MIPRRVPRLVTIVVAGMGGLLVLAGCSGVPTSSTPKVIRTVTGGVAPSAGTSITPPANAEPRSIVSGFLSNNVSEDAHHTGARSYLTADTAKKWTDTTAAVVGDLYSIGVADPVTHAVIVTADKLGTLDQRGVYTPVTQGGGSTPISLNFGLQQVGGQWRINTLTNGLILRSSAFLQTYKPRSVYFFDQSQKRPLPDLRYSALSDQSLCTWLLDQLIGGPRAELQSAYSTDLPEQSGHATVSFGPSGIVVDLPGANQLDAQTKLRLAVQLAFTFHIDFGPSVVSITDGSKPVAVPRVNSPFSSDSFPTFAVEPTLPTVYYVRNGGVVDENATPATGAAGNPATGIDAIALAQRSGTLLVAATTGKVEVGQHLAVGALAGPLTVVNGVTGVLTRPAWAPGLSEVWLGVGTGASSRLIRIPNGGVAAPTSVALASSSGSVAGQIRSIAFSPDGVRIALIVGVADGSSQIWIGSIVRTADGASVDSLEPITPAGLVLTDVAWNDASTLYAIGADSSRGGAYGIWSVQVDGSLLTSRPTTNLPGAPDSIAASQFGFPWVSADKAVWVQRGSESSWTPPNGPTALGSSPSYVQ